MKIINKILPLIILMALCFAEEATAQRRGVEIWGPTCGNCHSMQPASRYTSAKWGPIMVHMKINARLSDEESQAVLEYLKFGASDATSAVPAPDENSGKEAVASVVLKEQPSKKVQNQISKEEAAKIKAFVKKSEKDKKSKEK